MNKRVINISNPYHLSVRYNQLVLTAKDKEEETQIPVEDLGCVILEHPQITMTMKLAQELSSQNVALIFCDEYYMPASMLFHLDTHYTQQERYRTQIEAATPLKKRLWQQTVKAKIWNQALLLEQAGKDGEALKNMVRAVLSGDSDGQEAKAARIYWSRLFGGDFKRERYGEWPNPLLNYGYSILRGMTARALSASGLLPTLGIHHRNKYNAYCLADDIMEPYRPFVDKMVVHLKQAYLKSREIDREIKKELLGVLLIDTLYQKEKSPIQVALLKTAGTLAKSFQEKKCKIRYAQLL